MIAKIKTTGLSPVIYVSPDISTSVDQSLSQSPHRSIPVWIDTTTLQSDTTSISQSDLSNGKIEMWLSMSEIRKHFGIEKGIGQDDEWVACGYIALTRVWRIIPCDGQAFYDKPEMDVTCHDRIFNFQYHMWLPKDAAILDVIAIIFMLLKRFRTLNSRQKAVQLAMQIMTPRLGKQECDVWSKNLESLELMQAETIGYLQVLMPHCQDAPGTISRQDHLKEVTRSGVNLVKTWMDALKQQELAVARLTASLKVSGEITKRVLKEEEDLVDGFGALNIEET
jgi:hypothetical protein